MECRKKFTMCRLCLCESECFIDIFQGNGWFGYVAAEIINDLLQFEVSETDGYPHVICSICQGKLTDFKQFKEKCQNSRDTYDNMLEDDENHPEYPIDIDPSEFIKKEIEEGMNYVDTAAAEDIDPAFLEEEETITDDIPLQVELRTVKLEPKDPLDIQEEEQEVELRPVELEPEDHLNTQETHQEVSNCSIAFTSMEYSAHQRKRTLRESSYRPKKYTNKSVEDDGKSVPIRRKKAAVDANTCENTKSSCSSRVKVKKMDNKVDQDYKYKNERPYVCSFCRKRFKQYGNMRRHRSIHSVIKPFGCEVCGKNFSTSYQLKTHRLIHSEEMPYRCEVCGRKFAHKSVLEIHTRTHSGEKPYSCEMCGRSFARKDILLKHGRIHAVVRPYKCEVCVKYFADIRALKNHGRIHSKEYPRVCEICGVRFARKDELTVHARVHR